ncbi:GntR family transcriptional regulator [Rhizobium laguerreae]|uniref:GntR family transcriptional regulator n=1 Tax=Rhizobium laguerreae TaxID=1076926 RepID=UPI001C9034B4|nr:GntR family transcriptional regulator [Rhizobium laguerreae]MBY3307597.1 GntR family transcriptional regulator [Rhizobium laguerreae]
MGSKTDAQINKAVEAIKADIIIGRLRPREHLVEDDIMAKFGASRHTVRTVLANLEQMGLITRRPNKGAVVRDFSVQQVEEIYDVRVILQAEAARRLPMPADPRTIADLQAIHDEYCIALDAGRLIDVNILNDAFHRRIWQTCPNKYLADTIERLWVETTGIRWYGVGDMVLLSHSRGDHQRMIEQLHAGDRDGFVALAVDHILPPLEAFRRAHGVTAPAAAADDIPQSKVL